MIVLDTSAIIAILNHEPERMALYDVIAKNERRLVSAVSYQEAGFVMFAKHGSQGLRDLESFLTLIKAEIIPHHAELASFSIDAFRHYGKGIDAKARLNFCDCAAYALAQSLNAPLLFKGDDFANTDVVSCL